MAFGVMSQSYGCDRTGIASFIDAASYLVGYEGRRHGITSYSLHWHMEYVAASSSDRTGTASFIGHKMQLHTLLGMKAGVHVHPYAYIIVYWA